MGRPKEPVSVLLAKGKSHLSKAEIEGRKETEISVPFKNISAPSYLSNEQQDKFNDIARKLLEIDIMTELDVDCLARYVIAHDLYLQYTEEIKKALKENNSSALKTLQSMQDKFFRQAQTSARDCGLTITSRTKLVIPTALDDDDDDIL